MRILFINPPYTNFEGIRESAGHMMPLGFGYLASYARQRMDGLEFKILDSEAMGLGYDGIAGEITAFAPDVVGITSLGRMPRGIGVRTNRSTGWSGDTFQRGQTLVR